MPVKESGYMVITPQKRWQFLSIISDDALVSAAIADFGYLGFSFGYAFHRHRQVTRYFQKVVPLAFGTNVSQDPWHSRSSFKHLGIRANLDHERALFSLKCPDFAVDASYERGEPCHSSWSLPGGQTRTAKLMGMPTHGVLKWDDEDLSLEGHGLFDWTCGSMPWETSWKWSAGIGWWGDRLIAWNLRTGFDDPTQAENAIWIEGKPYHPGRAEISAEDTWSISSDELQLLFHPEGERSENLNLGVIASRYRQPWGIYQGTYRGEHLQGFGVAEEHWARW